MNPGVTQGRLVGEGGKGGEGGWVGGGEGSANLLYFNVLLTINCPICFTLFLVICFIIRFRTENWGIFPC